MADCRLPGHVRVSNNNEPYWCSTCAKIAREAGPVGSSVPGDTETISDEAVAAFEAVYWHEDTAKAREWPIREALAAVAPLLVSAEAERPSEAERDLARYVLMLEQSVEGLRAELAERTRERNAARESLDRIMEALGFDSGPVDRWLKAIAALRAAGGQEKPSDAQIDADLALDGFDPKDRYPEHGHDALRTAYRSGWESAGMAGAAVSGEQAQPDGETR